MRWIRRVFTSLGVLVLGLGCGAWLLFSLPETGWKAEIIPTGSMRPAIARGSLVFMHRVPISTLHIGDVITYANPLIPGQTVTHRIIKTFLLAGRIPSFITKGDANEAADIPIVGGSVKGRVMAYVPYVGYALVWARSWVGIAALVYLPTLLILVEEVNRLSSYYRLALPYRLASYHRRAKQETHKSMLTVPMTGVFVVAIVVLAWQPIAHALFHSNTVAIIHNRLSISQPLCQNADNTNNISIMNTSTQTAASGSASGGSANSGNASNSNNTNINITITGSHC